MNIFGEAYDLGNGVWFESLDRGIPQASLTGFLDYRVSPLWSSDSLKGKWGELVASRKVHIAEPDSLVMNLVRLAKEFETAERHLGANEHAKSVRLQRADKRARQLLWIAHYEATGNLDDIEFEEYPRAIIEEELLVGAGLLRTLVPEQVSF